MSWWHFIAWQLTKPDRRIKNLVHYRFNISFHSSMAICTQSAFRKWTCTAHVRLLKIRTPKNNTKIITLNAEHGTIIGWFLFIGSDLSTYFQTIKKSQLVWSVRRSDDSWQLPCVCGLCPNDKHWTVIGKVRRCLPNFCLHLHVCICCAHESLAKTVVLFH